MAIDLRRDKWYKHQLLMESQKLAKYLPETQIYTKESFWRMMKQYRAVIIKPLDGDGGEGILKISKIGNGRYEVHYQKQKELMEDSIHLERYLQKKQKGKPPSLVQTYIPLARVNGNPIDFRYIVQRKRGERKWVITGNHGKVAQKGYLVTNLQQGADIVTVEEALIKSNIKNLNLKKTMAELDYLSLAASSCLTHR